MTMSTRHQTLVNAVRDRVNGQRRGFTKAVLKAMGIDRSRYDKKALHLRHEAKCSEGGLPLPSGITPDVFLIRPAELEVICYEIESSASINERRLVPYVNWFWFLDEHGWKLRLFSVRAYSSHGAASELDLFAISTTWHIRSGIHIVGQLGKYEPGQEVSAPC